ncbi:MAG: hypothetical protein LBM23_01480 [Propionibacteriaceae bacterium]|jgi:hypothetical protein|nr:hypothetical protein [Propionibacteriaceae bacterium]
MGGNNKRGIRLSSWEDIEQPADPDDPGQPQTGDRGAELTIWQIIVAILGWILAVLIVWYFTRHITLFAVWMVVVCVACAVVIALVSGLISINVARPKLIELRAVANVRPFPRVMTDRLGRRVVNCISQIDREGDFVVVELPEAGMRMFVQAEEASVILNEPPALESVVASSSVPAIEPRSQAQFAAPPLEHPVQLPFGRRPGTGDTV